MFDQSIYEYPDVYWKSFKVCFHCGPRDGNRIGTLCSKARDGQVLLRNNSCARESSCLLVHVYINDVGDNLLELVRVSDCSSMTSNVEV